MGPAVFQLMELFSIFHITGEYLRVKATLLFALGILSLCILYLHFFGDQLFWTPNFSNLQYLRVKAPLFFVDCTRAFGGVCEADF